MEAPNNLRYEAMRSMFVRLLLLRTTLYHHEIINNLERLRSEMLRQHHTSQLGIMTYLLIPADLQIFLRQELVSLVHDFDGTSTIALVGHGRVMQQQLLLVIRQMNEVVQHSFLS